MPTGTETLFRDIRDPTPVPAASSLSTARQPSFAWATAPYG